MALNVAKEVAALERMSVNDLCERYRETFGEETNARNKRWLVKRIAWKLQANAEGDISERARRLAIEIALSTDIRSSVPKIRRRPTVETLTTASTIITPPADCRLPLPGTTLLKTYQGRDNRREALPQVCWTCGREAPCALRKHRFGRNLRLHWRGLNGRGSIDRHLDEGFRHLHPRLYGARFP